jgi:hypothetical protein
VASNNKPHVGGFQETAEYFEARARRERNEADHEQRTNAPPLYREHASITPELSHDYEAPTHAARAHHYRGRAETLNPVPDLSLLYAAAFRLVTLRAHVLTGAILFVLFLLLAAGIAQREYEFMLMADFQVTETRQWALFYQTLDFSVLTKRRAYSYFDGQPIVTGFVSAVINGLASLVPGVARALPSALARDQMATTVVNVLSYSAACVVFYATMYRITKSRLWSAIVAVALFLAPEMLRIEPIRHDFQTYLMLAIVIYVSTVIALRQEQTVHAVWLGIALAFASTIKITGLAFGIIPVLAYIARGFPFDETNLREWTRFVRLSLGVFLACYLVLMSRYLITYSIADWIRLYPDGWGAALPDPIYAITPQAYYNYQLLLPHGIEFIVLYIVSAVGVLCYGLWQREPPALLFGGALLLFSLIGLTMLKFERGGYHMLPFMYGCVGLFVFYLGKGKALRPVRLVVAAGAVLALLSSSVRAGMVYGERWRDADLSVQAVDDLWRPYRAWIKENLPYGSVCLERFSDWGVPHINDVSAASYKYGPFDYPLLSFADMARYMPPSLDQVRAACNVVVTNDRHRASYFAWFQKASPETAARWKLFYQELEEAYPPLVLHSAGRAGAAQELRIYALSRVKDNPCVESRAVVILPRAHRERYLQIAHVPALSRETDTNGTTPYMLCENDRPLGPSQSIHNLIRVQGNGRWSHWDEWIYFSTSDNTSPATNGRTYYLVRP